MPDRQRDHLILQTLVSTAWAMEPHVLQSMSDIVLRHAEGVRLSDGEIREAIGDERYSAFTLGALGARGASGRTDGELPYQREGAIAVIDISGVIAKRASMVNGTSQPRGTSIDGMRAAYRAARRDDRVKGVLFRGDSPGGSVDGVDEMAAEIRAGRDAGFPTWGFGDGLAASACYYMLAQCDRIYGTSDLRAPSIGVYTVVVDSSKAAADRGYRVHLVRAGNLKGVGTPGVAISADEIASIQARIDTYRGMFKAAVMAGRRADEAKVEGWADGNVLIGAQNVASGVIDGIATFEAVLEEMNRKFGGSGSAGGGFPPRAAAAALPAAPGGVAGALPAADGTGVVQDGPAAGEPAATVRSDEMNRTSILAAMAGTMAALGHLVPDGPDGPGVGGGGAPNGSAAPGGTVAPPVQPQRQPAAPSGGGGESVDAAKLAADAATRAIADERARVNGIREAAKAYLHIPAVAKLEGEAVAGTMGLDLFRAKLLTTLEGAMAPMGGGVGDISITGDGWAREKEAQGVMLVQKMSGQVHGLLMAGGPRADHVARAMGYESASAYGKIFGEARKSGLGRMRMIDICERHAHKARGSAFGPSHFADHDEVLGAAFGHATSDLPKLLQAGTQRMLLAFFALTPTTYQQWCQIGSLPDFRPMDMITVSETPELESLAVGEDVNEGKVRERYETAQLGTYAKGVSFDRRTLINDDLGAVSRVLQAWGSGAAALPDKLAYLQLTSNPTMQDGVTLFHASRGNVYTSAVLSHVSLTAAITAFMTQVGFGDDARYIDIAPRYLLVPTALWPIAEQITKSQYDPTAGNANSLVPNVVGDKVTPVVSRRLHAASAAKWYLAADPNNQPLVVVNFLNGRREPIVTQVGNGSILGARYEVIFDCNAKAVQPEAGGSNAGG